MNQGQNSKQQLLVNALQLAPDRRSGAVYGNVGGYSVIVSPNGEGPANSNAHYFSMIFSVRNSDNPLNTNDFAELQRNSQVISSVHADQFRLVVYVNMNGNDQVDYQNIQQAMNDTIYFLQSYGYVNVDESRGGSVPLQSVVLQGVYRNLSPETYQQFLGTSQGSSVAKNPAMGALGAFLGSLVGAIAIILIYQLGYVAAISGIVMAAAAIFGYQKLGGKLDTQGIIITAVIMIVVTFIAHRVGLAMAIASELGFDFSYVFSNMGWISQSSEYWFDLIKLYIFVAIGAVPQVIKTARNSSNQDVNYRLGE